MLCQAVIIDLYGFISDGSRWRRCARQSKPGKDYCAVHQKKHDKARKNLEAKHD